MNLKKVLLLMLISSVFAVTFTMTDSKQALAQTYTYDCGNYSNSNRYIRLSGSFTSFNRTHNYSLPLYTISSRYSNHHYYIDYILPDDGSTWQVVGFYYVDYCYSIEGMPSCESTTFLFDQTVTTPGTFPYPTIDQAVSAANAAKASAEQVADDTNDIRNNLLSISGGIVQDANGTVLQAAREAKDRADQIYNLVSNTKVSIPPQIINTQGVGGATCTSSTSYSLIVTSYPESGVVYNATLLGPSTGDISIVGNIITFSNLTDPGAYTATITATNDGGTSSNIFNFFKV
ncbi:MAG: hypothetical protein HPY50_02360 [Firmicutes bacterium]|nr:hypothetical protein [Bacillota bacterium]